MSSPKQTGPFPQLDSGARARAVVADLAARIQRWSPDLDRETDTFRAAVLVLAGQVLPRNVDRLAQLTGFPRDFVARCARRLVDNGVWQPGAAAGALPGAEEELLAFWADVGVAEGKLCRRVDAEGRLEWAPAGYWHKNFDYVQLRSQSDTVIRYHETSGPSVREIVPPAPAPRAQNAEARDRRRARRPAPSRPAPSAGPTPAALPSGLLFLGEPQRFADTVWLT